MVSLAVDTGKDICLAGSHLRIEPADFLPVCVRQVVVVVVLWSVVSGVKAGHVSEGAEAEVRMFFGVVWVIRASELLVVVWMVAMWLRQLGAGF